MFCYSNNGLSWRHVDTSYQPETGEIVFVTQPTAAQIAAAFAGNAAAANNAALQEQIDAIEATQTKRRLREAALGTDNGWLKNSDAQITALRAKFQ